MSNGSDPGPALGTALAQGIERLGPGDEARADAALLLAEATGRPRHHLWSHPEARITGEARAAYVAMIERRRAGEPVAHILGRRGFWTFDLEAGPAALIPRPETELAVETALGLGLPERGTRVLDLGTGTGAIAIALALERPAWEIVASDVSEDAIALARRNVERLGAANVELRRGGWFEIAAAGERFALIVSNPPYVAAGDPHLGAGDVRFDPPLALLGGADGLDAVRAIVESAPGHLAAGGWIVLEHGFDQGAPVRGLLAGAGFDGPRTARDLGVHERVTVARWPSARG